MDYNSIKRPIDGPNKFGICTRGGEVAVVSQSGMSEPNSGEIVYTREEMAGAGWGGWSSAECKGLSGVRRTSARGGG